MPEAGWLAPTPLIKDLGYAALQAYEVGRADPASGYARAHPKMMPAEGEHIPTLETVVEKARDRACALSAFRRAQDLAKRGFRRSHRARR